MMFTLRSTFGGKCVELKNVKKIKLIITRDQGILASERMMLQRKPREDLSDFEVTAVRKYLKVFTSFKVNI